MKKILIIFIILFFIINSYGIIAISKEDNTSFVSERSIVEIQDKIIIRIYYENDNFFIPKNSEIISGLPGYYIDVAINESELLELSLTNLAFSIIDYENINENLLDEYHTLAEMEQILTDISLNYPDITRLYSIGLSYEGRNIWCLEISDNPGIDEGEPGVLFMGVHHAREWPTMEICLNIANKLTSNYVISDEIRDIVNNRRIWIVTCVNPDGYYYDYDLNNGNEWWRKNRHYFTEFNTYGVDLNRNYAGSCNGDDFGMWGSNGMSHNPDNNLFCGLDIFSEFETQVVRDLIIENDICAVISWHTYGELVMWPWGYTTHDKTPNDEYLSKVGTNIALRISNQDEDGTYTPTQAAGLYPTTGDTCDWIYGYGHYVLGRQIFPFTIEACESFHPYPDVLEQVCEENYEGALYLLHEAENISNLTPRVMPPIINDIQFNENGDYIINWDEKNLEANVSFFQLDELEELEMVFDDSENENGLWSFKGFNKTGNEYYSNYNSYQSHILDDQVSSMTTVYPLPISEDLAISFWCKFDIEDYYDMAFFEVSRDGRLYDVIDTFTGDSQDWIFKNYYLDEYEGESIFIRFRYSTDENTHGEGFFVDDISPIADFGKVTMLSENLTDTFYEISDKPDGIYFYRIRGFNSEYGWGDFCTLKRVINQFDYNKPPSPPSITGKINGKFGEDYEYSFISDDPEDGNVFYYVDWGDGEIEEWIGPYQSGELIYLNHTWIEKGNYVLRAKSKDNNDIESYWGTLEISMPKNILSNNIIFNNIFMRFMDNFPLLNNFFRGTFKFQL